MIRLLSLLLLVGCTTRVEAGPWHCEDVGAFRYASVLDTDGIRSKIVTTRGEYVVRAWVSGTIGDSVTRCRRDGGDTWVRTSEVRVSGQAYWGSE